MRTGTNAGANPAAPSWLVPRPWKHTYDCGFKSHRAARPVAKWYRRQSSKLFRNTCFLDLYEPCSGAECGQTRARAQIPPRLPWGVPRREKLTNSGRASSGFESRRGPQGRVVESVDTGIGRFSNLYIPRNLNNGAECGKAHERAQTPPRRIRAGVPRRGKHTNSMSEGRFRFKSGRRFAVSSMRAALGTPNPWKMNASPTCTPALGSVMEEMGLSARQAQRDRTPPGPIGARAPTAEAYKLAQW